MSVRSVLGVAGLWLVTVAGASALTWSVISGAGAHLAQPGGLPAPSAEATAGTRTNPATWAGPGGKVTARCAGAEVSLVTATPAVGFSVEVKDGGPQQLVLEFERGGEERESRVRALCVAGAPTFTRD